MSFGFLGIQFGFALQNANVSRIFETLGADIETIPILWIAAPVTGLIVQPIVGYLSDNTWNRFGRRRPYFLIGAILSSLALIVMPNSPYLWVAAGMLWILDASINISMEPFRAFVGDMLPSEQRTKGFAMQSFFIGTGAVVASALPYVLNNWVGLGSGGEGAIPDYVKWSFYIGAAVFFISVLWTVFRTREYSPEELQQFDDAEPPEGTEAYEAQKEREALSASKVASTFAKHGPMFTIIGVVTSYLIYRFELTEELFIVSGGFLFLGLLQIISAMLSSKGKTDNGLVTILTDLYTMPKTMKQLAVVQFFSWFALFSLWIYTTAGVTSHHYDMDLDEGEVATLVALADEMEDREEAPWYDDVPRVTRDIYRFEESIAAGAEEISATMRVVNFFRAHGEDLDISEELANRMEYIFDEYNEGADWVGIAFAVYNGFAALVAFGLPVMARYTNRRVAHAIALIAGAIGLISVYFVPNPNWILVSMLGVGLAWASILAMPYAILAGALPAKKMGIYMGIFNFFIVLPQMLAAAILGFVVAQLFSGQAIFALILGGAVWILAAIVTVLFVDDVDEPVADQA